MNRWQALIITLSLLTLSLATLRAGPGFRAWQRVDQATYWVMLCAVWPWLITSALTDPPLAYTLAAAAATIAATAVFMTRQIQFLRRSKRELRRMQQLIHARYDPDDD